MLVLHSNRDGWQKICPVTLYVTQDGTIPRCMPVNAMRLTTGGSQASSRQETCQFYCRTMRTDILTSTTFCVLTSRCRVSKRSAEMHAMLHSTCFFSRGCFMRAPVACFLQYKCFHEIITLSTLSTYYLKHAARSTGHKRARHP